MPERSTSIISNVRNVFPQRSSGTLFPATPIRLKNNFMYVIHRNKAFTLRYNSFCNKCVIVVCFYAWNY